MAGGRLVCNVSVARRVGRRSGARCGRRARSHAAIALGGLSAGSVTGHDRSVTGYAHDADGNTVQAGADRYGWDLAGRMTRATVDGVTTGYGYDGDGNRSSVDGPAGRRRWLWDVNAGEHRQWLTRDALGSVTTATDPVGQLLESYAYQPYGQPTTTPTAGAGSQPWRFTGGYYEPDLGAYHLRARQYHPDLGRFLTTDPLTPPIDDPHVSAYLYVDNRPGVLVDPSGQVGVSPAFFEPAGWGQQVSFIDDVSEHGWFDALNLTLNPMVGTLVNADRAVVAARSGNGWEALRHGAISALGAAETACLAVGAARFGSTRGLSIADEAGAIGPGGRDVVVDAISSLQAGRRSNVRTVASEAELDELWARLSEGGSPVTGSTYRGREVLLPDGTRIGIRPDSTSGGPTIDINRPGSGNPIKVHVQP